MKKVIAMLASVLAVASVLVGVQLSGAGAPEDDRASALSGSQFDPGNIIPDSEFYNGGGMNETQVQTFLNAQIGTCSSSSCLNVGRYSLNSHGADAMCNAVTGGSSLTAAQIITRVGAACGINPKVIIVTLQKEQALVNGGTARNPSAGILARAMGYACPDSANGGCDPAYSGVGNQVYWASWQWKRYGNPAGTSNYFTWFAPGGNRNVQYNPNAACGTKSVYIQNKATAALYYYTPYTPNQAALNNLYGTGDSCSAYGNRNFWRLYNDWFGVSTADNPFGGIDAKQFGPGYVQVGGWAIDPNAQTQTVQIQWYSDGQLLGTLPANASRPDVGRRYPGAGNNHGILSTLTVGGGTHTICAVGVNIGSGSNAQIGACQTVDVMTGTPIGGMDASSKTAGQVTVNGWTIDPDTAAPVVVDVYVDDVMASRTTANASRPDVGRRYVNYGDGHGIDTTFPATGGSHQVCAYAFNTAGPGTTKTLGCQTVTVGDTSPFGGMDVKTNGSTATVNGWTIDPDTKNPLQVRIAIDGVQVGTTTANTPRADVGRRYPTAGPNHGINVSYDLRPGAHTICATAVNVAGGSDKALGCATFTIASSSSPFGGMDAASTTPGRVQVNGWTIDPDQQQTALRVDTYLDGVGVASGPANASRSDVGRAYPAAGPLHGINQSFAARAGSHTVCSYAINVGAGKNVLLGCQAVTVK
ncbi:hypothetical protein QP735_03685 [Curtobacterium citreum]|uniref:hypothetical protein n=1 Tax=Curtobacterium citreum TaxID=2036 RepID=UPI00254C4A21|nr:hypothetical protein [Curtobacterium citreum]MDK8171622.1 hypothetical protein [Curtobacterium citreum]